MRPARIAALMLTLGLTLLGAAVAQDPPKEADDLALLQGTWERTAKAPDGKATRVTKRIKGHREELTVRQGDQVIYAHEVEFVLQQIGPVRIFSYRNAFVTAGPDAGTRDEAERAYLYDLVGDDLFEADGFLHDDRNPGDGRPQLAAWHRAP